VNGKTLDAVWIMAAPFEDGREGTVTIKVGEKEIPVMMTSIVDPVTMAMFFAKCKSIQESIPGAKLLKFTNPTVVPL
jgi:hypothetical protein